MYMEIKRSGSFAERWGCKYLSGNGLFLYSPAPFAPFLDVEWTLDLFWGNIAKNMFIYMQINRFGTKSSRVSGSGGRGDPGWGGGGRMSHHA